MTDYKRNSFSPVSRPETIVRAHSPYSEATGPILRDGTVAARIRAFHSIQIPNAHAPPNKGSSPRVQLRSNKVTSPTTGGIKIGDDNRSGYGRRKSLCFAPPASRNASVAGQNYLSPTRSMLQSSVLPGSGVGTRVERVWNQFAVVGAKTASQHDVPSPRAVLPPKQAGPEESPGLSPGTKPAGERVLAESKTVNIDEASTEHTEVLKGKSIAEELGVMIDKAIDDHNSSQTEWSSDSPNSETHDHQGLANSKQKPSSCSSTPPVAPVRSHTSPDDRSIAATKYRSTSSGSDHSQRHRRHGKLERRRECSTAEETIMPRSSSDTGGYPTENLSSLDDTPESDTTVQRHFSHRKAALRSLSASLPASTSPCLPQTYRHHHGRDHHHRPPRWGTTPARTVIVHETNELQEMSRPRLIRKYQISSLLEDHHHHHDRSHQVVPSPHIQQHTPPPIHHLTPPPHHHHPLLQNPSPTLHQHPNNTSLPQISTHPPPPPTTPPSLAPPPPPPPPIPPLSARLPRFRPPLRHHSLPTLAPPLLSPPLATASLLQTRHLSASAASPPKPARKKSAWWRFVLVDKTEIIEKANEMDEMNNASVAHTRRKCGHEANDLGHVVEAAKSASASAAANEPNARPGQGSIAPAPNAALRTRSRPQPDDGKRSPATRSDASATAGNTGEEDAWRGEQGGRGGIRGVTVVVSLDGGGDLVVEARVRGVGREREGVEYRVRGP